MKLCLKLIVTIFIESLSSCIQKNIYHKIELQTKLFLYQFEKYLNKQFDYEVNF